MNETPSVLSTNGPSSLTSFTNPSTTPDKSEEQSSEIQCICGFHDDDGYTICCDQCDTWQHLYCVDIKSDRVPDTYLCPNCLPRPLDVRKAKEHQQSRRERKEKDKAKPRNRKKPNSNANSSKKRDHSSASNNSNGTPQNSGPGPPTSDKSAGPGKSPSPRDSQQGNRKRGAHRTSISNASGNNSTLADASLNIPEGSVGSIATIASNQKPVLNGTEIDSDAEIDKAKRYKYDFTDITASHDYYVNDQVQYFVNLMPTLSDVSIQSYTRETFNSLRLPKLSIHDIPDSATKYSAVQRSFVATDDLCITGQLVALCKGEIGFQRDYKSEAINQYSKWRHPKPFVFFHPVQPICIDSRIKGTIARFVKRSCHPNLSLRTIVIDNSEVLFGLFVVEPLQPKSSLTIQWEWSGSPAIQRLQQGMDIDCLSPDEYQEASSWVQYLAENFGDCACQNTSDCLFAKFKVKQESVFIKPYLLNGKDNINHVASDPLLTQDQDCITPKRKSRSRDLSPSTINNELSDVEMSSREARKMRNIVSRIEKLEQEEQPQGNKRRKKSSTVNTQIVTSGLPPPSPADWKDSAKVSENGSRIKSVSVISSPPYTPQPSEGIGEHVLSPKCSSDSRSLASEDARMSPSSAIKVYSAAGKPKTPIKVVKRPAYVDVSTQTDPSEGPWWLCESKQELPVRPVPMSLKKRLMQDLKREEENNRVIENKKRKLTEEESDVLTNLDKGRKLSIEDDVKSIRSNVVPTPQCTVKLIGRSNSEVGADESLKLEPSIIHPDVSTSAVVLGLMSATLKADHPEQLSSDKFEESSSELLSSAPFVDTTMQQFTVTNGHRKHGLSVQLPPPQVLQSSFTNASSSPILAQSRPHSPAISTSMSILSPQTPSTNSPIALGGQPVPPKTKKLSLSEYRNLKKADAHERDKLGNASSKLSSVVVTPSLESGKAVRNVDSEHLLVTTEAASTANDASC